MSLGEFIRSCSVFIQDVTSRMGQKAMCKLQREQATLFQVKAPLFCFHETSREGSAVVFIWFMVTSQMYCICFAVKDVGLPSGGLPPVADNRRVCPPQL